MFQFPTSFERKSHNRDKVKLEVEGGGLMFQFPTSFERKSHVSGYNAAGGFEVVVFQFPTSFERKSHKTSIEVTELVAQARFNFLPHSSGSLTL